MAVAPSPARDFLLAPGKHVGVPGHSDDVVRLLNARFDGVLLKRVGDADVSVGSSSSVSRGASKFASVAYAALVDSHTSTRTLLVAFCLRPSTKTLIPATTLDRLPWVQLHVRTYLDAELDDLFAQVPLDWAALGPAQELGAVDESGADVELVQDGEQSGPSSTATYHSPDRTFGITIRAARSDGRGGGNDLPSETTFVPALELFDAVMWLER